jgi:hypothetical protein
MMWLRALFAALLVLLAGSAGAHEMSMAEMQLQEISRGDFVWQWTASADNRGPVTDDLTPVWPAQCKVEESLLHCGGEGLSGELSVQGVGDRYSAALVKVIWLEGGSRVYTLTAGQPTVHLYGSADDRRGAGEIARAYTLLGIEHILSGIDHLLFVIGLLFLVGFKRQLFWTITAFTLAHSLTLALSVLGLLTLRSAPVEASIALSIVLVAGEALSKRQTLAKRWPALLAFLFGLVHGLGFAGALKEVGLPQSHLGIALGTFNLGVEIGQLMTVGAAAVVWWLLRRTFDGRPQLAGLRVAALYVIGSIAAFWSWGRIAAII